MPQAPGLPCAGCSPRPRGGLGHAPARRTACAAAGLRAPSLHLERARASGRSRPPRGRPRHWRRGQPLRSLLSLRWPPSAVWSRERIAARWGGSARGGRRHLKAAQPKMCSGAGTMIGGSFTAPTCSSSGGSGQLQQGVVKARRRACGPFIMTPVAPLCWTGHLHAAKLACRRRACSGQSRGRGRKWPIEREHRLWPRDAATGSYAMPERRGQADRHRCVHWWWRLWLRLLWHKTQTRRCAWCKTSRGVESRCMLV